MVSAHRSDQHPRIAKARRGLRPLDINTGIVRRDDVLVQKSNACEIYVGFGRRDVLVKRLEVARRI
jgi:hypothetical protein